MKWSELNNDRRETERRTSYDSLSRHVNDARIIAQAMPAYEREAEHYVTPAFVDKQLRNIASRLGKHLQAQGEIEDAYRGSDFDTLVHMASDPITRKAIERLYPVAVDGLPIDTAACFRE